MAKSAPAIRILMGCNYLLHNVTTKIGCVDVERLRPESIFGNRPFAYVYTVVLVWMMCHAHKTSSLISMKSYYDSSLISSWYDLQSALAYGWVLFMGSGSHELVVDSATSTGLWPAARPSSSPSWERFPASSESSASRILLEMDPTALTVFWLWISFTLGTIGASVWRARGRISTLVAPIIATFLYYLLGFAVLYFSPSGQASLHLHHSFTAGVLSFWYRPEVGIRWPLWQQFFHGICFGIFFQGFVFYGRAEFQPLESHGEDPPWYARPWCALGAMGSGSPGP